MNHIAVSITIEPFCKETEEILTAELSEIGYEGFLSETPVLKAYIEAMQFRESHLKIILDTYGIHTYSKEFVAEKNWNADWESRFDPIVIKAGKGCSVRAPGKEAMVPVWPPVKWRLVIEPALSFGTGHHPTTYMMMETLLELEQDGLIENKQVLDFGCGTGVLAILAAKMDAVRPVHAVDNDRRSVQSCRENARRNRIAHKVAVQLGDASLIQFGKYGLIMANIQRNILIDEMDTLARGLRPDTGHLLLSGFYVHDVLPITEAAKRNNLVLSSQKEKEDWVLLHFIKSTD